MSLSVAIITLNEEANIRRTLESVKWADEIVIVDSGSTDKTCEIAREFGAKVFIEPWKGFAAQKNSTIDKCTSDWILSLDADEEASVGLSELWYLLQRHNRDLVDQFQGGFFIWRQNLFLGRWIKRGGYYPDEKLRLFRKGSGKFEDRPVHEDYRLSDGLKTIDLESFYDLGPYPVVIHHAYPTLSGYIEHMNRYSSLGAAIATKDKPRSFSLFNIVIRPIATFIYNYFLRFGFLDGREGLLLHLYHSVYVSWKYAKAWERGRAASSSQ